ncbi:MAG: hypothetical protein SGI72_17080 [Planctomycetota bacterium]|nr:hypothetical protein [Planctomycetota bacterium]
MNSHLGPIRVVICSLALLAGPSAVAQTTSAAAATNSTQQIAWQRSLDDALALAAAERRPLLVAVNVDGESASDRIVTERYRAAHFVAWTQRFVCVVGSPSRHNPRDFDTDGKRIPCPRLGDVTCGEHIALEPIVFDRYLGGERISPRHAVIQPDGKKSFDLFLLFDLKELDAEIERCAEQAPVASAPAALPNVLDKKDGRNRLRQWRILAAARTAKSRDVFEQVVRDTKSEGWMGEALDAIAEVGDAGSIGVLRALQNREPLPSPALLERVGNTAQSLKVGPVIATSVRERLASLGKFPGWPSFGDDRVLLKLLARFGVTTPAVRSFLLAHQAVGAESDRDAAGRALAPYVSTGDVSRIAAAIEAEGGACDFPGLMIFAGDVGRALPRAEKPAVMSLPTAELERELESSDTAVGADLQDPVLQQRFGRASLALAVRYVEAGGGDPRLLFEDARTWLARAAAERPNDVKLAFDRAKAAYYLGRFEEQERIAQDALAGFPARDAIDPRALSLVDPRTLGDGDVRRAATLLFAEEKLEALRWIGDAAARVLATRASGDAALEVTGILRGARALALVAVSPSSTETDWLSLASFMSAIGFEREAACAWEIGAIRLPESNALREGLNRALWAAGRLDLAPKKAEFIASRNERSGTCAWHAAYAWILFAEESRKEQRPEIAIDAYARAARRFEESITLRPEFEQTARHYAGMAELGSGFAQLAQGRRVAALDALLAALKRSQKILDVRDGLDREVPDFVDALLEWRDGKKSPLDARVIADKVMASDPKATRVVLMIADAALREALRADGRAPVTGRTEALEPLRMPSTEGDEYMSSSIAIARSAVRIEENEATRAQLAQSLAVQAERWLARESEAEALPLLDEAARILGLDPPSAGATLGALNEKAAEMRALLGPARPVFRVGR